MALLVVLALAMGAVVVRLAFVQALSTDRAVVFGESQRLRTVQLPARRGSILDRNGAELAISVPKQTVWADPRSVLDPAAAAKTLGPVLGQEEDGLREQLSASAGFVYLARKVDNDVARKVTELNIAGVGLIEEPGRLAPGGSLAAPLLGTVGIDDQGLSGLELQLGAQLQGKPGELLVERGPDGRDIAAGTHRLEPPARGGDVVLTIDRTLQFATEQALGAQITATNAKGGIAVVMDPASGEVLAMANLVAPRRGGPAVPAPDNMALTRVYEPGSVNKVITVAAALEEGKVGVDDVFSVPDHVNVADGTFRDIEPHAPQALTTAQILSQSSNVGAILIGRRLGRVTLDKYLRDFGLGRRTELAFPGESAGLVPAVDKWSGTSLATVPIGQGLAVTAVQMLSVFNVVANDGEYVAPSLVRHVVDDDGRTRSTPRTEPRRVISESTARQVRSMLVDVVTEGTGGEAAVAGYTVAGKTGTARKVVEGTRGYQDGAYVATFAGFLPAEDPKLSVIVVLDEPTPIFGGVVSAPVFAQLASQGVRVLEVPPEPGQSAVAATLGPSPSPVPSGPAERASRGL